MNIKKYLNETKGNLLDPFYAILARNHEHYRLKRHGVGILIYLKLYNHMYN
jgi:hypothetical protein